MILKRSAVRAGALASVLLLASGVAFAKGKEKEKKKDDGPEHKSGLMEDGSKDPAETETMDEDGAFVPGKKKKFESDDGDGDEPAAEGEAKAHASSKDEKAEAKPEKKAKPPKKTIGVFAEALVGLGKAPVPGPANRSTGDATSIGILVGGHFDLSTSFRLMLRVPWVLGTVKDSTQKDVSSNALGVPELAGRLRLSEPGDTEWALRLGIGIPVAQGNPDPTAATDATGLAQANLLRVADGANGWHDPELYAPKRLPVSPAVVLTHRADKLRLNAELKAVFMPKIGGNISAPKDASGGTTSLNGLAVSTLIGGSASYEVLDRKFIALNAWFSYTPAFPVVYDSSATKPTPFQLALEPKILAQFGHVVPSVGVVLPVSGQLGGNILGIRAHVDVVF